MINDTIADMLTRLRNAHLANKTSVVLRATRVTRNIAQLLFQEGFLSSVEPEINGMFEVTLKRSVKTFQRVSTPGVRMYVNHKELVYYTYLRAHETIEELVCCFLLYKRKQWRIFVRR